MGINPYTGGWVGKENNLSITEAVIRGEIEGYPVEVHITGADLQTLDEESGCVEGLKAVEVGVFQYIIGQMQDHGILPAYRRSNSPIEAGTTETARPATFTCPLHGDRAIFDNKFRPGKKKCQVWEPAVDGNPPEWSVQKTPSNVGGQLRWYCKHQEA